MPEMSEIMNANELASPLAPPLVQLLPETSPPAGLPRGVGIEPRALLEELRANRVLAEQAFLQRNQEQATPPAPEALRPAEPEPVPAPPSAPPPVEAVAPLAETAAPVPEVGLEKHLIFSLGPVRYAVPLDHIIEIGELEMFTPVPHVPDWILGITNLRGDIISLVDLNALSGEAQEEPMPGSNLLIAQNEAGNLTTGLIVDRVHGVTTISPTSIQHLDQITNQGISVFSRGYVNDGSFTLSLLDLESLLNSLVL
jgi:purine-binding chemotaxis protein CheW